MLPSQRPHETNEGNDDEGSFNDLLVGAVFPDAARASSFQPLLQQDATSDEKLDQKRPAKRARTQVPEVTGEQLTSEADFSMEQLQRFPTNTMASQFTLRSLSRAGMIAPEFFRTSGISLLQQEHAQQQEQAQNQELAWQQEQARNLQSGFPFFVRQGQHQEQLLNSSLVSLLGSAHRLHHQFPTVYSGSLRMNPSIAYSDRASLHGTTERLDMFHPLPLIQHPQQVTLPSRVSLPPFFHQSPQATTSIGLMPQPPIDNRALQSRPPTLDLSELSYLSVMGGQISYQQPTLSLGSLQAHPFRTSARVSSYNGTDTDDFGHDRLPSHQYLPSDVMPDVGFNSEALAFGFDREARLTLHSGDSIPLELPVLLARPKDREKLSLHQILLRHQIEAFKATGDDVLTHTRGRNKVGIRCRHCKHLPVAKRQKGAVYFPATLSGIYQASQNMSTTHMQCGLCSEMPMVIKHQFAMLMSTKASSSGAGRPYWAEAASKLGLVDTDDGIRFIRDVTTANAQS